jgi:hypothetical protein
MHLLGLDQLWIFGYVDLDGVQSPITAGRPAGSSLMMRQPIARSTAAGP